MDEKEIQEQLADKVKSTDPIPEDGWSKVREQEAESHNEDQQALHRMTPEDRLQRLRWFDYFGLAASEARSAEAEKALTEILDWAATEAGSHEYTDMLRAISDQERVLGIKLEPGRLTKLYNFAKIRRMRLRLIEQERALYG